MTQPPEAPKYTHATYIEERSPKWKYHTDLGKAKNAVTYMARDAKLYEIDSAGQLILLWNIPKELHDYRNGHPRMPWKNEKDELIKAKKADLKVNKLMILQSRDRLQRLIDEGREIYKELRALENDGN